MSAIRNFLSVEAAAGMALLAAAIAAIIADNSPLSPLYGHLLHTQVGVTVGSFAIEKSLLLWINDGLMAIFFFLIGLEIKREVLEGELSTPSQIALPAIAAIGGMIVPALIYLMLNGGQPLVLRGWAIPTATDIAFALGILMLLGKSVPLALKVFLTTVAVFDDLGAIVIIALFYTDGLSAQVLMLGVFGLFLCWGMNRIGIARPAPYILMGILVWTCFLKSGVHATLAGVALGLTIPLAVPKGGKEASPLRRLEHGLHPWVAFFVLPVFAFANAGVRFDTLSFSMETAGLPLGIALGLVVGKQIGVFGASWAMIRLGLARMPTGTTMPMIYGVSVLCGIGFTMSLFIGGLAFDDASLAAGVRLGVLGGSVISGLLGFFLLRAILARAARTGERRGAARAAAPRIGEPARQESS